MNPFAGKKILVAGGSGLVGTHLVIALAAKKAKILASFYSRKPRILKPCYRRFDFTRREDCLTATRGKELVFLCAAVTGGIQSNQQNPLNETVTNLKIQYGLLDACRKNKVKKVILISSSTVYHQTDHPVREDELDLKKQPPRCYLAVGGFNRYVEQLADMYSERFGMSIAIVRPTNLYGPFDHFEEKRSHVLPALIKRALAKENPFVVWGRPGVIRDFLYVEDFVGDLLDIARRDIDNGPLNVAYGKATRIGEAVKVVLKECGHYPKVVYDCRQPAAAGYRMVSMRKFESLFGKRKRTSLAEGVRKTIQWYQNAIKK